MALSIYEQVKIRLGLDEDSPLVMQLIEQATSDVIRRRSYPDSYSESEIAADLKQYESVIVNLAVYDYSQAGEAYMQNYNENGVNRSWIAREKLLDGVYAFIKFF